MRMTTSTGGTDGTELAPVVGRWSDWFLLKQDRVIEKHVPENPGIYEIRLKNCEFGRVLGGTSIVNIGRARDTLYRRLYEDKACDPEGNHSGTMKWIKHQNPMAEFEARWFITTDAKQAELAEVKRLAEFICRHGELPPGQPYGCRRIKDIPGRSDIPGKGTDLKVRHLVDSDHEHYIDIDLSNNDLTGEKHDVQKCMICEYLVHEERRIKRANWNREIAEEIARRKKQEILTAPPSSTFDITPRPFAGGC